MSRLAGFRATDGCNVSNLGTVETLGGLEFAAIRSVPFTHRTSCKLLFFFVSPQRGLVLVLVWSQLSALTLDVVVVECERFPPPSLKRARIPGLSRSRGLLPTTISFG